MDPTVIVPIIAAVIKTVVDLGPSVIKAVEDAEPFAKQIVDLFSGGNVTQDQLDALLVSVQAQSAALQAVKTDPPPAA